MRTFISHRDGPLRSPRPFDDIHTRDNAANRRTVLVGRTVPQPRGPPDFACCPIDCREGDGTTVVLSWNSWICRAFRVSRPQM
jgi:hypothetical protein